MAYVKPDPAYIKARYPDFANVPNATIQAYIDDCPVDNSWLESDYMRAIALWVCHTMSINGIGGDDVAEFAASGIKSFRSGALDVSFAENDTSSSDIGGWDASKYGKQFFMLLRQNKGGPRVAAGGGCGLSGWAKDWPAPFGWSGWHGYP